MKKKREEDAVATFITNCGHPGARRRGRRRDRSHKSVVALTKGRVAEWWPQRWKAHGAIVASSAAMKMPSRAMKARTAIAHRSPLREVKVAQGKGGHPRKVTAAMVEGNGDKKRVILRLANFRRMKMVRPLRE